MCTSRFVIAIVIPSKSPPASYPGLHSVSVDRGSGVGVLAGAEGVGRSDLLTIDIRDTKPSELLAVNNSDDGESRSRLGNVSPRDGVRGARCAGLVGPGLSSSVLAGHADDGTALSLAIGLNDEVVVAASVALTAVAAQVVKSPCLVGLLGTGARGTGRNGDRRLSSRCRARTRVRWVAAARYRSGCGCDDGGLCRRLEVR